MISRTKANEMLLDLTRSVSGNTTTYYYLGLGRASSQPKADGTGFAEPVPPAGTKIDDESDVDMTVSNNEYKRITLAVPNGSSLAAIMVNNITKDNVVYKGLIRNDSPIMFDVCRMYAWGSIKYFGIFTSAIQSATADATTNRPIFWGELDDIVNITVNSVPVFFKDALQIGLDQNPKNLATDSEYEVKPDPQS